MKKGTFIIILLFAVGMVSCAQETPEEIVKTFFDLYTAKGSSNSIDYLFGTNKFMGQSKKEEIESLKIQLSNVVNIIGNYKGYEFIVQRGLGDNFIILSYLVKYERQPLRFNFIFYRPDKKWQVQNFKFDDSVGQELEEAVKVYRLREVYDKK